MSQALQLQKARNGYQTFIRDLSAFRASHVASGDADSQIEPFVEVQPTDALDAFLIRHPECNEFRDQLQDLRSKQEKFFFIEDRWQKTTATKSA